MGSEATSPEGHLLGRVKGIEDFANPTKSELIDRAGTLEVRVMPEQPFPSHHGRKDAGSSSHHVVEVQD